MENLSIIAEVYAFIFGQHLTKHQEIQPFFMEKPSFFCYALDISSKKAKEWRIFYEEKSFGSYPWSSDACRFPGRMRREGPCTGSDDGSAG